MGLNCFNQGIFGLNLQILGKHHKVEAYVKKKIKFLISQLIKLHSIQMLAFRYYQKLVHIIKNGAISSKIQ